MAREVRIPVPAGIVTHQGVVREVILREPSFDDYLDLGEIVTFGQTPDKTIFPVENAEILRRYIAKCLVSPADPLLLNQGGLALARAVKDAVMGFFRAGSSGTDTSKTSQTTSSSSASPDDSPPTPSAA